VCGVSAMRSQHAGECMEEFREGLSDLKRVYVLHKGGYEPSNAAKFWVEDGDGNQLVTIATGDTTANVIASLDMAPAGQEYGLLVLPADRFFSEREAIFTAAAGRNFKTFWSVTDFVGPNKAYGGHGVPQKTAGRYMAWQVDKIWDNNGRIPKNPRWLTVKKADVVTARDFQPVPFVKGQQKNSNKAQQSKSKPSRTKKSKPSRAKKSKPSRTKKR
jgi:hypothetical protein